MQTVVEDDRIGLDPSKIGPIVHRDGGFDLFIIRERLNYLGGRLRIQSESGYGTRVTLTAPLKPEKETVGAN